MHRYRVAVVRLLSDLCGG
jgi:hypothetical protein